MSVLTFKHLPLLGAERQLAGRCLTSETTLRACLNELPIDCWRSEEGRDLARIFYALAGRLERGAFNPETNEIDLGEGLNAFDRDRDWPEYIDGLWCPWMAVPAYAFGVLSAVTTAYRQADLYRQSLDELLHQSPLAVSVALEEGAWERLREVIATRRQQRTRKMLPDSPPPPVNWEAIHARRQK